MYMFSCRALTLYEIKVCTQYARSYPLFLKDKLLSVKFIPLLQRCVCLIYMTVLSVFKCIHCAQGDVNKVQWTSNFVRPPA